MTRARTALDTSRLSAIAARPGVDPRINLTLATILELGFDAEEGLFADVMLQPAGLEETCLIGGDYAGENFGMWFPLQVGDTVLVGLPDGDPAAGPIILKRLWSAQAKPPADFGTGEVPTDDVVLRVRPEKNFKLRTSGAGKVNLLVEGDGELRLEAQGSGRIVIEQSGTADIVLKVADGHLCYVGDTAGAEPIALGQTLATFLASLSGWLNGHVHTLLGVQPGAGTLTTASPTVPSPTVPDVKATKGRVR